MSGDSNNIESLIRQYKASEESVNKLKQIYDKLEEALLQDTYHLEYTPSGNLSVNGTSKSNSSPLSLKNCKNKHMIKNDKSSTSVSSLNRSSNGEEKLNISKTVERRIHQIENCKNILRQAKTSDDKLFILETLSNNRPIHQS